MICHIYRGCRKADAYLYLPTRDDFASLPPPVLRAFGRPEYSMSLHLTPGRKLAQADADKVIAAIEKNGYFIQLPRQGFDMEAIERRIVAEVGGKAEQRVSR